ncbi:hypothetical protein K439DRAFT_287626 [Ramaria rubella]|nr:hypothetical protein K439DRAFT_287626 [Ramaria rubella]
MEGRFDHNVELVISAPELDLTLPEDSIYAREVSLQDLGVLHTGCDLSGPLSLRLDTISPRFGTRYKAIRDEILRVVSQQEEDEHRSQSDPTEGIYIDGKYKCRSKVLVIKCYLVTGAHLYESPDNANVPEGPSSEHDHPYVTENSNEQHETTTEGHVGDVDTSNTYKHDVSEPQQAESEVDAEADDYDEGASGEYTVYNEYVEGPIGDNEETYEGAEEYSREAGEEAEEGYEGVDAEEAYDENQESKAETTHLKDGTAVDHSLDHEGADGPSETSDTYGPVDGYSEDASNDEASAANPPREHALKPSTRHAPLEDHTHIHAATSTHGIVVDGPSVLDTNEATSPVSPPPAEIFPDAEPLLSEAGPSRSVTPRVITHVEHVIAYEDTVDDDDEEQYTGVSSQTVPTNPSMNGSRAASTASKRSYDEHERDQLEDADSWQTTLSKYLRGPHYAFFTPPTGETKRLKVD